MRGARREVSIVRGNVREIRARIRVISEAACEAARYCALLGREGEEQSASRHHSSCKIAYSVIKTFVL